MSEASPRLKRAIRFLASVHPAGYDFETLRELAGHFYDLAYLAESIGETDSAKFGAAAAALGKHVDTLEAHLETLKKNDK